MQQYYHKNMNYDSDILRLVFDIRTSLDIIYYMYRDLNGNKSPAS